VTEKFLELTLEPYRREIGQQFGKRVPGVFTDEPNIRPLGACHGARFWLKNFGSVGATICWSTYRASPGRSAIGEKSGTSPFVQLLEAVHEIDGLERIRFTSPHPKGYGADLVAAYARLPKLVESAHIPVQSGSDRVLKRMHRGYTRQRFLNIIENLRKVRPQIGITTDLIVGFPGETEADFEETLSLVREVEFQNAFIFKYSIRRDTPAATMPNQVPQPVKEERNARLLALVNEIGARKYRECVGQQVQILVEGPSKKNPARMMGRTRTNKIVVFDGSQRHRGQLMEVKVTRAGSFTLHADPAVLGLD